MYRCMTMYRMYKMIYRNRSTGNCRIFGEFDVCRNVTSAISYAGFLPDIHHIPGIGSIERLLSHKSLVVHPLQQPFALRNDWIFNRPIILVFACQVHHLVRIIPLKEEYTRVPSPLRRQHQGTPITLSPG